MKTETKQKLENISKTSLEVYNKRKRRSQNWFQRSFAVKVVSKSGPIVYNFALISRHVFLDSHISFSFHCFILI